MAPPHGGSPDYLKAHHPGGRTPAIELEHATIPAYLASYYSIVPKANLEASAIVRSVVIQEMLHMCIAANLLNALGGLPSIDPPQFIPSYPGPLPMSIGGDSASGCASSPGATSSTRSWSSRNPSTR